MYLKSYFIAKIGDQKWTVSIDLDNGMPGGGLKSERVREEFDTRTEADDFLVEVIAKYPQDPERKVVKFDLGELSREELREIIDSFDEGGKQCCQRRKNKLL